MCQDWQEFGPFHDCAISHDYSDELTIDRIDVNRNYDPSNCRWVTQKEQQQNKRNNVIVDGLCFAEQCRRHNLPEDTVRGRLKLGWSIEEALNTPVREHK